MTAVGQIFGEGLKHRVEVYVPGTLGDQELDTIEHKRWVRTALRTLAVLFGGATAIPAQGSWVDNQGQLIVETVTLVYSHTDTLSIAQLRAVHQLAAALRNKLNQEAVAVSVDGTLYLI
jgi:hypothetical protein